MEQLSNTGRFYMDRAQEIEDNFKAGRYEESYRLCRLWLSKAELPPFYRAAFKLLLASGGGTDEENVIHAEQALAHFSDISEGIPENAHALRYKSLAQSTLDLAKSLKAVHEKEAAERRNEWTDEQTVSWLLERTAIECGQRTPEDSLREIQLALASGQFPGMGTDTDPTGDNSIRIKTLKPEERAAIQKGRFADPKPIGSAKLKQYGKQKPRPSIINKKWTQLEEADKAAELASSTEKAKQAAQDKLAQGVGGSYVYEEENGQMEELLPPRYNIEDEGVVVSSRRIKPVPTFSRELSARLSNIGERFDFWAAKSEASVTGLPTPAMSQGGDLSERNESSEPSSVAQTPGQSSTPKSPRTPMHLHDTSTPLSRTPLAYRRKPSEGNLKKRTVDEEEEEEPLGTVIKRVKSKG